MPERKLLFFGNGLGMSLDPNQFDLRNALRSVWDSDALTQDQKRLISRCLPQDREVEHPIEEDELGPVQQALVACDILIRLSAGGEPGWLSPHGVEFPSAVRSFIHNVACHFFDSELGLHDYFLNPLVDFINATNSHVATTNYDNLLYQPFIERGVLRGLDGPLVDGMFNRGFSAENLERRYGRSFGVYMHLHGSPLYYDDDDGLIKKMKQPQLAENRGTPSRHIVLTNIRYKSAVIYNSYLLSSYADYFERAINEASEIVVVGYGGGDTHLNSRIRRLGREKPIRVVEREAQRPHEDRLNFWRPKLGSQTNLVQLPSILEFNDW